MSKADVIRSWKDPFFRSRHAAGGSIPNPAGLVELSDEQLKRASGMYSPPQTTNEYCTNSTFRGWKACCP